GVAGERESRFIVPGGRVWCRTRVHRGGSGRRGLPGAPATRAGAERLRLLRSGALPADVGGRKLLVGRAVLARRRAGGAPFGAAFDRRLLLVGRPHVAAGAATPC